MVVDRPPRGLRRRIVLRQNDQHHSNLDAKLRVQMRTEIKRVRST
jgi:ABC-type sugar transport system ATPase subunit